MTQIRNYECIRCRNKSYETGEMRVAGGFWSKVFDVEGRKFTSVTCTRCKHTEFFQADKNTLGSIFDLFVT